MTPDEPVDDRVWPTVVTPVLVLLEGIVLTAGAISTGSAVMVATAAQSFAGPASRSSCSSAPGRARMPAAEAHPLGHGRESFFWSLIASLGVFVGGGVIAMYDGMASLGERETPDAHLLGYLLLGVIVVVDLGTLWAASRPVKRLAAAGRHGFWTGLHRTSDADGRTLVYDDAASVLGGLIGIGGLAVHQLTGDARADAVASLLIGVVLLATTAFLLSANRELLTDHTIPTDIVAAMRARICEQDAVVDVPELFRGLHRPAGGARARHGGADGRDLAARRRAGPAGRDRRDPRAVARRHPRPPGPGGEPPRWVRRARPDDEEIRDATSGTGFRRARRPARRRPTPRGDHPQRQPRRAAVGVPGRGRDAPARPVRAVRSRDWPGPVDKD